MSRDSKTRILTPVLGNARDDLYYNVSTYLNAWAGRKWSQEERNRSLLGIYNLCRLSRNKASGFSTWPYGSEAINCTTGRRMNNCTHIKQCSLQYPTGIIWSVPSYGDTRFPYWRWSTTNSYWREAAETARHAALMHGFDQLFSARAFWSMRPRFESDVSLINSIFELKDFADVVPSLATGWSAIGDYLGSKTTRKNRHKQLNHFLRAVLPRNSLRLLSGLAAGAVLTMNLAIKPTIADVISIHAAAKRSVYDHARQFRQMGLDGARSHYSERHVLSNGPAADTGNYRSATATGKYVEVKNTATMVSFYDLLWQNLEDAYPKWWGLQAGAAEVWNMLPLSFVLDYFLTVGKSLEYMQSDDHVRLNELLYCESVKARAELGRFIINSPYVLALIVNDQIIDPTSGKQPLLVTGTSGTYYQRIVKEPYKGPALPRLKLPSTNQAVNMLALARAMLV